MDDDERQNEAVDETAPARGGMPGDGVGRREDPGHTGVYPASGPLPDEDLPAQGMASWGQGSRGAAGYEDSGSSELGEADTKTEDDEAARPAREQGPNRSGQAGH